MAVQAVDAETDVQVPVSEVPIHSPAVDLVQLARDEIAPHVAALM